jgi:hypothetical protein
MSEPTSATAPEPAPPIANAAPQTAATSTAEPGVDADGRLRPAFVLALPPDAGLKQLSAAFERGDFASVRALAPAVIKNAPDETVRRAAEDLRRRIDPDPAVVVLLLLALGLFSFLLGWAYLSH